MKTSTNQRKTFKYEDNIYSIGFQKIHPIIKSVGHSGGLFTLDTVLKIYDEHFFIKTTTLGSKLLKTMAGK